MKILSHRGYWTSTEEKNTAAAFRRSFDLAFGTETDVRDRDGQLVISHDIPTASAPSFDGFLELLAGRNLPLAINIKSDGLAKLLRARCEAHRVRDYFVFDMSVPDMRHHFDAGNPVFTRLSEVERDPAFLDRAQGVWLDAFESEWYSPSDIQSLLKRGKRVCVVSPELHRRPHQALWSTLKDLNVDDQLLLCTDLPEDAKSFFGVQS